VSVKSLTSFLLELTQLSVSVTVVCFKLIFTLQFLESALVNKIVMSRDLNVVLSSSPTMPKVKAQAIAPAVLAAVLAL
jgi:hypothetical protein